MKDFFISYNSQDKDWAVWMAWTLEKAGYDTVLQAWDFRAGSNFVVEMQKATTDTKRTLAVLSQNYLNAEFTQPEWAAAFVNDPMGNDRKLVPVRIDQCEPSGLLAPIIYVDLNGMSQERASQVLLDALESRGKPDTAPAFPGSRTTAQSDPPLPTPQFTAQAIDWNNLSGQQQREFQAALLTAYPSRSNLEQMLFFEMNTRLDQIVGQGNMRDVLLGLLKWASPEGRMEELYRSALADIPGNPALKALEAKLIGLAMPRPTEAQTAMPSHATPDGAFGKHGGRTTAGGRNVSIGGNVRDSVIITGDGVEINLPSTGAPFPGPTASTPPTDSDAIAIWKEKLAFFREQEAVTADPAQKFALKKQIAEAEAKIRELS